MASVGEKKFAYTKKGMAKAKAYAEKIGATFLPLGFDVPKASEPFIAWMKSQREKVGSYDEIWIAAGSGMTARCIAVAFPEAAVHAVAVSAMLSGERGKPDPDSKFPANMFFHRHPLEFEQMTAASAPFPSCGNYDRKAWEVCRKRKKGRALFWNVAA